MKAFTSIEQSKKLAEILPIESADMMYDGNGLLSVGCSSFILNHRRDCIPCWSFAELIELLSPIDNLKPMIDLEGNSIYYSGHNAPCSEGNTLVNACVEMILNLKKGI